MMCRTSECVSLGHPDKVADYVASYLLDRYLERDPAARFAMECQIKDSYVTLGGEVTSAAGFREDEIADMVRSAIREIGYTAAYASRWPAGATLDADRVDVVAHIGRQSPDIARGVDSDGWGDQGIFWGMASRSPETGGMPLDIHLARGLCAELHGMALDGRLDAGLDIKSQVSVDAFGRVDRVVVAIPLLDGDTVAEVRCAVERFVSERADGTPEITVNGTGAYVRHASQGDCGTTGRKLAADLYGGNCRIGGGCPWGKDPTKADVALNAYARRKAVEFLASHAGFGLDEVHVAISCCIGRRDIRVEYLDGRMGSVAAETESRPVREIIAELGLDAPVYASLCRDGLVEGVDGLAAHRGA